ncbi:hypothetical protein Vretimale_13161 [Volvox reticuliferus]|uniref:cyclin-dependent kinase n=1 Tax=Volvox reticuliferus TaxID=1737510 RepID=A0A8J4GJQ8_9CHLO|nr:hypothetical protein Vretimale_13161 [Volvox reticuliferus]
MDWRVLELLHVVDEGAYGVVLAVRHRLTGESYAVKAGKHASADPRVMYQTLREVKILRSLGEHPNVVRLADAFRSEEEHVYLVFEMAYSGLHKELERLPGRQLPAPTLQLVAWQLLQGLLHCHDHQIVHRDVKPSNVLVSRAITVGASSEAATGGADGRVPQCPPCAVQPHVKVAEEADHEGPTQRSNTSGAATVAHAAAPLIKLCDFGFARHVYCSEPWYGERYSSYVVTRYYRAPEVLVGCKYGASVDIWSYGCTLAELAIGRPLFPGTSTLDQLGLITRCLGPLTPSQADALSHHPHLGPTSARTLPARSVTSLKALLPASAADAVL